VRVDNNEAAPTGCATQPPASGTEACRHCGVVDKPTLMAGSGPHAIKAVCAHCGRFMRWISMLAPQERMARKMHHRLKAMQARPPSAAQLAYLRTLGHTQEAPQTMAEASERIEALKMKMGPQ
jgi:hypothetical protein